MKVLFYSEQCEHSKKLLEYLEKHNIKSEFKFCNIDVIDAPEETDIVPTILDSEINQPLKGKKAFEYVINLKYFNNPTNNIELVKEIPANPEIPVDEKASSSNLLQCSELNETENVAVKFYQENTDVTKSTQTMVNLRNGQDKKFALLMQMKRK